MSRRGENIYKRRDGRYEGRYIKGRRPDGSLLYGYVYGGSYEETQMKLAALKYPEESVRIFDDGSLRAYLKYWLDEVMKERIRISTYERYHERINGHILPELGKVPVCMLNKDHLQTFVDNLNKKGLAQATIINILRILRASINEALELGFISSNPCDGVVIPEETQEEAPVLSWQEQYRLEQTAGHMDQSVELSVLLTLYAGLRTGEICALKWHDIDITSAILTVRGTLQRVKVFDDSNSKTVLMETPRKGRYSQRRIPLPSGLLNKLQQYGDGLPGNFYVLSGSNKPFEPRTLRMRLDKAAKAAGIDVTYQDLRRTYIHRCLKNDCDSESLSRLLGHSDTRAYNTAERDREFMEHVWLSVR